jgi:Flp pilus assembly protein TadD
MRSWPALFLLALVPTPATAADARLTLVAGDREAPAPAAAAGDLAKLRAAVEAAPKDREKRFALVRALIRAKQLDAALEAARAWRATDAYNLVVVRLLGDIYSELGRRDEARRTYSAVVELLPKDASAQRALASVLKQSGDLRGAYDRLRAAADLAPKDRRLAFELADVAHRLGETAEARTRLEAIVADKETPEPVRYPAKQRLAQIYHQLGGLAKEIEALAISGGTVNDIKVYLTWDTDRSDVDLWVTSPGGERVFYEHKVGRGGEALHDDITTGYGPESYTAKSARAGEYLVQVNYYGAGRSNFAEARGEVVIVLDEGKPGEQRHVLPYRLFEEKQTVAVARIKVGGSK